MVSVSIGSGVASSVVASGLGDSASVTGALTDSVAVVRGGRGELDGHDGTGGGDHQADGRGGGDDLAALHGGLLGRGWLQDPDHPPGRVARARSPFKATSRPIASAAMDPAEPAETARAAAERAGVTIVDGDTLDRAQLVALAELFGRVWGRDPAMGPIVSAEILWATAHVGSPVAAAWRGDTLVGGSTGFVGVRDGTVARALAPDRCAGRRDRDRDRSRPQVAPTGLVPRPRHRASSSGPSTPWSAATPS